MARPGVCVHLWILLLIQILLWTTPSVSGLAVGEICTGTTDTSCVSGSQCVDIGGTGGSTFQCRLNFGEMCTDNSNCTANAQCANDGANKKCRLNVGEMCTDNSNCTANAQCADDGATKKCRLNVGEMCTDNSNCTANAQCANDGANKKCRLNVGEMCTDNSNCTANAQCANDGANKKCRLNVGEMCTDNSNCTANAQCANDGANKKCRLNVGEMCTDNSNCTANAQCADDGATKKCRLNVGEMCTDNSNCTANAQCADDGATKKCRLNVGEMCTDNSNCTANAQCADDGATKKCRLNVGEMCTDNSNCTANAQCANDGANKKCRLNVGEMCTDNSNCTANAQCANDGANKKCRLNVGEMCTDNSNCTANAQCANDGANKKCRLNVGEMCTDNSNCTANAQCADEGANKKCRKRYGETCAAATDCQMSHRQTCVDVSATSDKRCLCDTQSFWLSNQCDDVATLKATGLQMAGSDHQETSINVTWKRPQTSDQVQYQATLTSVQNSSFGQIGTHTFHGLTQGTQYMVSVTARTLRNPNCTTADLYATVASDSVNVYTKPAQPGHLLDTTLPGPNVTVTFTPSAGNVSTYSVTVTSKQGRSPKTVNSSQPSVVIVGLVAGQYYNVTIVAISYNISSVQRTDSFRVQAKPAGVVTSPSLKEKKSRWAQLTWTKPDKPNGVISGYTVKLQTADMSCFSGVVVRCSDCTYNSSEVTPNTSSCTHSAQQTLTGTQMANSTFVVEVNVTQLMPHVHYKVEVAPFNEAGAGVRNITLQVTTDPEAAASLVSLGVSAGPRGQLAVNWTAGERRGETNYTVSWEEQASLGSDTYTPVDSVVLQVAD
ncbi:hypothetical protein ACOMHN_019318 [Nucella lapillus]